MSGFVAAIVSSVMAIAKPCLGEDCKAVDETLGLPFSHN